MSEDLLGSTLEPTRVQRAAGGWRVPSLTVLFHLEEPGRAGDVARLIDLLEEGRECSLSRLEPLFIPPRGTRGRPLGDRHLSRSPVRLVAEGGGVRIVSPGNLRADGKPLAPSHFMSKDQLEQGVVLEMADRVLTRASSAVCGREKSVDTFAAIRYRRDVRRRSRTARNFAHLG